MNRRKRIWARVCITICTLNLALQAVQRAAERHRRTIQDERRAGTRPPYRPSLEGEYQAPTGEYR